MAIGSANPDSLFNYTLSNSISSGNCVFIVRSVFLCCSENLRSSVDVTKKSIKTAGFMPFNMLSNFPWFPNRLQIFLTRIIAYNKIAFRVSDNLDQDQA